MEGAIGVLYQDSEQVGGVFDWSITIGLKQSAREGWEEWGATPPKIAATSYWLLHKPRDTTYQADFFQYIQEQLVLMDSSIVQVEFPDLTIGKRLWAPVRMKWMKSLSF